jgi:hypothetical protein
MTLQLLHSEFPYKLGKFDFLFYQCTDVAQRLIQTTLVFRQYNGQILPYPSNCENLIATNELLNSLLPAKQGYCLPH